MSAEEIAENIGDHHITHMIVEYSHLHLQSLVKVAPHMSQLGLHIIKQLELDW